MAGGLHAVSIRKIRLNRYQIFGRFAILKPEYEPNFVFPHIPSRQPSPAPDKGRVIMYKNKENKDWNTTNIVELLIEINNGHTRHWSESETGFNKQDMSH